MPLIFYYYIKTLACAVDWLHMNAATGVWLTRFRPSIGGEVWSSPSGSGKVFLDTVCDGVVLEVVL